MMDKFKERPFTSEELLRIHDTLERAAEAGQPKVFQVLVDGLAVIDRTDDPAEFELVLDHIDMDSDYKVEVRLYNGRSNRSFRYYLYLERNRPAASNGGDGLAGIEARFEERTSKMRLEWEHKQLLGEHKKLQQTHQELEQHNKQLQADKESLTERVNSRKFHWGDVNLAEIGGVMLEGLVRRNTGMISRLPGGAALAGLIEEDNQDQMSGMHAQQAEQTEGGFTSMDDQGQDDQNSGFFVQIMQQLQATLSEGDFDQVLGVLHFFLTSPPLIASTLQSLSHDQHQTQNTEVTITEHP